MELLSEEEQWERLKHWLRTNGPFVLILLALMLIGFFGWKWWQNRTDQQGLAAGAAYQAILTTFDQGKPVEAMAQIEALRTAYPKSPYVAAADLVAARVYVERNDLAKAVQHLQRVVDGAVDEKLKPIAKLRLARVQSAQGQYDAALATLGGAGPAEYEPARLETRGDVLYARGDRAAALADYEAARKVLPASQQGEAGVGELLDLKIADLKGSAPAAASEAPAAGTATPAASTP